MDRGDRGEGWGKRKGKVKAKRGQGLDPEVNEDGRCSKERFDHVFMLFMLLFLLS